MSRGKSVSKGGACTRCGRHHPPGKKRRSRLKAKGLWNGCNPNSKAKVKSASSSSTPTVKFDADIRAAKNATVKERNETRRVLRKHQADERNAKWQSLTLEEQLEACKASPYNKAKQIAKIKQQIQERDENDGKTRNSAKSSNDNLRGKRRNRPPRRTRKKG